jgi:hypothetical protein
MAAEDLATWLAGRNPSRRILYASYSESLGMRMSLNLQRMMMSEKYREVFPYMRVGFPGRVVLQGIGGCLVVMVAGTRWIGCCGQRRSSRSRGTSRPAGNWRQYWRQLA